MIQTAVADVIRPAVATVQPHDLFAQLIFVLQDVLGDALLLASPFLFFQRSNQGTGIAVIFVQILEALKPCANGSL